MAESEEGLDGTSLSEVLHIQRLPTFVLFNKEGLEVGRAEGAAHKRPAQRLHKMLKLTRPHANCFVVLLGSYHPNLISVRHAYHALLISIVRCREL